MSDEVEAAEAPSTSTQDEGSAAGGDGSSGTSQATRPRRRRRGGRGRGRGRSGPRPESGSAGRGTGNGGSAEHEASESSEGEGTQARTTSAPKGAAAPEPSAQDDGQAPKPTGQRRRRRRGGRGREGSKSRSTEPTDAAEAAAEPTDADEAPAEPTPAEGAKAQGAKSPRRRRRRGSGSSKTAGATAEAKEEKASDERGAARSGTPTRRRTRSKTETADATSTGPAGTAGPTRTTRVRSTRTRTGGGRRRREPLPVVKRAQDKLMAITEKGERDQIAILEDRDLVQHYVTRAGSRSMVGNVYLGRVQNVLPGMEAAFVDIGRGRNAVLYAGEVNYSPEDLVEGKAPRIEQVLKSGQSVLVQVTKDPIGGKGARLTAQVSMPGRYVVLVPDSDITGISRRLPLGERRRIKAIVKKVRPEGFGLIVRTAADGVSEEDITVDIRRVAAEWEALRKRAKKAKAPAILYEEPEITVRVVRDLFTGEEFRELVTDSPRIHETVTSYLRDVAPDLLEKVRLHEGKLPVFEEFHIVEQIHKGLDRKVWLPSGGYLIVERTEAMTVIDVNTGKHVGKTNLEETVVATNLEAATEVARQLRLRDIGGIIIIDFIDMLLDQNKKLVEDTLKEAMAQDRTRSQVFEIGPLGLCEVTRKRVSGGLLESFSETCPTCEGRGILLTHDV